MLAAGLLARNAVKKGLKAKPWVKTTLAPGSKVVTESPSLASTRAPEMSTTGDGSGAMPSKYGGLRT